MTYSIDAIVKETGISAMTLRNWEKRYGFLSPQRLPNGFRSYTEADILLLKKINSLLMRGIRIGDIATALERKQPLPEPPSEIGPDARVQVDALYDALRDFDIDRAEYLASILSAHFSPSQMFDYVFSPLLERLGADWAQKKMSVAQEHFASAFFRLRLAPYLNSFVSRRPHPKMRAICTTPPGELHEGGLMLLAAHLKLKSWTVFYLGPNVPFKDLKKAVAEINPGVLCLSITESSILESAIAQVRDWNVPVCIGGIAVNTFENKGKLPPHVYLLKAGGKQATEMLELIVNGEHKNSLAGREV